MFTPTVIRVPVHIQNHLAPEHAQHLQEEVRRVERRVHFFEDMEEVTPRRPDTDWRTMRTAEK